MSRRDDIIKSASAARMLETVSPIYDDSHVGLWLFEVIGREYDGIWDIIKSLPEQLFPETATWGLELWERRYGITTDASIDLETRRAAVLKRREKKGPLNPALLESLLEELTGRKITVVEDNPHYRFVIQVQEGKTAVDYAAMVSRVNKIKPSHLAYNVELPRSGDLSIFFGAALYETKSIVCTEYDRSGVTDFTWLVDELGNTLADESLNIFID